MWDLVYALLQLVANVAAVHYVAPHFSKVWLFVVFMVEPVLRNAIATAGKLTVTNVDDVFYAIVTEVGQFLFLVLFGLGARGPPRLRDPLLSTIHDGRDVQADSELTDLGGT